MGAVEALLDEMELLLVLAVNPGFPGQAYLASTDGRVAAARRLIGAREIVLAVDGGITKDNIGRVAALGVDLIVSGSAVFDGVAPLENARSMLEALRMTRRSLGSAPNVRGDPPPVSVGRGSDAEA